MIAIMSEAFPARLAALATRRLSLARGASLFRAGDAVRGLHVVERGLVELARDGAGGERLVLQRAGAGELLAEASCFSARYHCDATAREEASLAFVPLAVLTAARESPDFVWAMARHLALGVQALRGRAELLSRRSLAERLDGWIALNGPAPPRPGGWAAVAAEIAVTAPALYRELARRRRAGSWPD